MNAQSGWWEPVSNYPQNGACRTLFGQWLGTRQFTSQAFSSIHIMMLCYMDKIVSMDERLTPQLLQIHRIPSPPLLLKKALPCLDWIMQSLNLLQPGHLMESKCLWPVSNLDRLSPLMSSPLMLFLKRKMPLDEPICL